VFPASFTVVGLRSSSPSPKKRRGPYERSHALSVPAYPALAPARDQSFDGVSRVTAHSRAWSHVVTNRLKERSGGRTEFGRGTGCISPLRPGDDIVPTGAGAGFGDGRALGSRDSHGYSHSPCDGDSPRVRHAHSLRSPDRAADDHCHGAPHLDGFRDHDSERPTSAHPRQHKRRRCGVSVSAYFVADERQQHDRHVHTDSLCP